jgi:hypothetical protein
MTVEQLATIVSLVGAIVGSAGWLHGSLNRVHTDVRVLNEKLDGFSYRIKKGRQVVSDTTETTSVKAGYKTTEFWLSVAAMIVGALFASGIFPVESTGEKILGLAATVLTALGYQVSRTLAKRG